MEIPETRYAKTADDVYLAYQVVGEGPVDVVYGFNANEGNVDLMWDEPDWRPFLERPTEYARVITFDRRGTGASSRNVALPNLETQVDDLLVVLDAADSERPILAGGTDGGAMLAMFAATHPDRGSALIWNNPSAKAAWSPDYPWGQGRQEYEEDMRWTELWGTDEYARGIADWRAAERAGVVLEGFQPPSHDVAKIRAYARINRNTASPDVAREVMRIVWETDVRGILPAVHIPAALVVGELDAVDEARYIAGLMPNASVHVLPGRSGMALEPILDILRDLAGVAPPTPGMRGSSRRSCSPTSSRPRRRKPASATVAGRSWCSRTTGSSVMRCCVGEESRTIRPVTGSTRRSTARRARSGVRRRSVNASGHSRSRYARGCTRVSAR